VSGYPRGMAATRARTIGRPAVPPARRGLRSRRGV